MNVQDLITWCKNARACEPALRWLRSLDPKMSAYDAWRKCDRWEWLQWFGIHLDLDDNAVFRALEARYRCKGRVDESPPSRPKAAREYRKHVRWSTVRDAILSS